MISANGEFTYTLDNSKPETQALEQNEKATDIFSFTLIDDQGEEDSAEIRITVNGAIDGITASDVTGSVNNDGNSWFAGDLTDHGTDLDGSAGVVVDDPVAGTYQGNFWNAGN